MEPQFIAAVEREGEQRGISQLSQAMKELIFEKLSLQSISSCRMVCKEWNSILSLHSFLSSLPTQNPWLLICGEHHEDPYCLYTPTWYCKAYCFSTKKWRTISLSFLPKYVRYYLTSGAQGLLLFREVPKFCVCNPLLKIYAEIEIDVSDKFIHIVQGGNGEPPYLVACSNTDKLSFQIYHYFQDSWRIKFQFVGETGSNISLGYQMVECNGVLFWMGRNWPMTIAGYNIQDGVIKPVTIPPLPRQLVEDQKVKVLSIVAYGSSILVVAVLRLFVGIVIWELFQDEENKLVWKWKEFARMPRDSLPEYLDEEWWHLKCVCVGDYLCFSTLFGRQGPSVAAYNLREEFWQSLPPCKTPNSKGKMMSLEPNLIFYQLLRKLRE